MTELKPCPFCGAGPTVRFVGDDDGGYHEVSCYTPHSRDAEVFVGAHASSEVEAIAAWNRRVAPSAGAEPEVVEAARKYNAAYDAFFVLSNKGEDTEEFRDAMFSRARARDALCRAARLLSKVEERKG